MQLNPPFWRDRPTLVTGATGLVGSWVVKRLHELQANVVCLVRDWVPQSELARSHQLERVKVVRGDVRDQALLERALGEYEIDTVIHLAAQTIVPIAARNPISTFESNIAGTWTILEACRRQCFVKVKGQSDILICGIPYISPYNVSSILNPLLVQVMACGYFFNMNRGIPLVKKGGTLILTHPCMDEFDPVQHPSYIEFFHRLLPETTDAMELHRKYEREFAQNPSYVHLYRKGNAYHGAHPFYMWYWGENGRQHLGQIIAVGAENQHVPRLMGWERADTLAEAVDMARGRQGRTAEITLMHHPPLVMTEVAVSAEEATRLLGEAEPRPQGGAPHKPGVAAKEEP